MIKKLLLLLTTVSFMGCSDSNTDLLDKLQTAVEKEDVGADGYQVIAMESLTDFEWETMYFFQEGEDEKMISDALGFKWQGATVPPLNRRLLFVQGDKVVSYTDYDYNEFPLFVYGCNTDRWVYPRSRSRFATFKYCASAETVLYPFIPVECIGNLREMVEAGCPEPATTAAAE
jgi:hypothetical protein